MNVLLLLTAGVLCVVTGANDGAALAAMSARVSATTLGIALLLLAVAVVAVPLLSVEVAVTLSERLVDFSSGPGRLGVAVGTLVAVTVVAVLAIRGEPTSLTLALVGALGGVGWGAGQPVAWSWLLGVLGVAALSPFLAAFLAAGVIRVAGRVPSRGPLRRRVVRVHRVAFALQAVAYASNDGQKMLAVAAVALPSTLALHEPSVWGLLAIGALFLLGSVLGLPRVGRTLSNAVLPVRAPTAVTAELAAATAVIGSSVVAAPVSMTQSITGALVGAGVSSGNRSVRWGVAVRLVRAWGLTLPAAFLVAAAGGALAGRMSGGS